MKDRGVRSRILLLTCLQLTGVCCDSAAVFVYRAVGSDALLPCPGLEASGCSLISWTFFGGSSLHYEVKEGQMNWDSDKASRMSILSNCSLVVHYLTLDDVGSYVCLNQTKSISNVFVSLLSITSSSKILELQPGGHLVLSCILATYYDAGNCGSYSGDFRLGWTMEDGAELPKENRYKLTDSTPCNLTLAIQLEKEDDNRKWRCQVNTTQNSVLMTKVFTSTFLFHDPPVGVNLGPLGDCPVQLPISRVVLCVTLPLMVIMVGIFSWRRDRAKANVSEAQTEL